MEPLAVVEHLCAVGNSEFAAAIRALRQNHDDTTRAAGLSVLNWIDQYPNEDYALPETSPNADARGRDGKGYHADQEQIQQFGSGSIFEGRLV